MNHLSEEQLVEAYYGAEQPQHLGECEECRAAFENLRGVLDEAKAYPVPERGRGLWRRSLDTNITAVAAEETEPGVVADGAGVRNDVGGGISDGTVFHQAAADSGKGARTGVAAFVE